MITNQVFIFLIFTINGIIIGLLFDFFRILRKSFKTKDIITYIQDIIFWILTGIIILYSTFTFNNGEIRLFMILGIILGAIIYMIFISSYVIKVNLAILTVVKKILYKIFYAISIPFNIIYKMIKKIVIHPITFLIINIRKKSTKLAIKNHNKLQNIKKQKNIVKN